MGGALKQSATEDVYRYWRKRILISIWISYAMFYVGRVNMGVAIPLLQDEFGYTKTALGAVLTALFFTYGIGQFVNGQLGDKLGGRVMIAAGLILSAVFNLLFGFSTIHGTCGDHGDVGPIGKEADSH
ncbi:unnamed protein product [marine sediment metagenome]|uniref:Major facilitator superfamily (MFS) profile domain-containing protein n=1 Tax=marine sediment metagenome TaxID=412755 RepID=X1LKB2_9ZZZZ